MASYIEGTIRQLPDFVQSEIRDENEALLLAQEDYVQSLKELIQGLLKGLSQPRVGNDEDSGRCVMVMPPLSQWAMIITEAVVKDCYSSLAYFVVGPGVDLRVVICHEDLIQRKVIKDSLEQMELLNVATEQTASPPTGHTSVAGLSEVKSEGNGRTRRPDKQIYIPKPQRDLHQQTEPTHVIDPKWIGSRMIDTTVAVETIGEFQPEEDHIWTKLLLQHIIDIRQSVGSVYVVKPDWSNFGVDYDISSKMDSSALGHVLELFDFPSSFLESDLVRIFHDFKAVGFTIHWTDDTHAIIRFSTREIATEALMTVRHPSLKCRPISIASRKTKLMLSKCPDKRLPYKRRPQTEPQAAKRLILTALGMGKQAPGIAPK